MKIKNLFKKVEYGYCPLCENDYPRDDFGQVLPESKEVMFNLLGIKVCEGCYHDLINLMNYKKLDDMLDCDKERLMKFLNLIAKSIK